MYSATKEVERTACQLPDETKDERAIRLRSAGLSFREIAGEMDIDVAMAHRRVKRALIRQRCERDERMQDVRDVELEKLRRIEKAILPEAFEGDLDAARLALRIIEMRRRLLKELPLEEVDEDPWGKLMDDDDVFGAEEDDPFVDDAEKNEGIEPISAKKHALIDAAERARRDEMLRSQAMKHYAARGLAPEDVVAKAEEDLAQIKCGRDVVANGHPSTNPSTQGSTGEKASRQEVTEAKGRKNSSRQARRKEQRRIKCEGKAANKAAV